MKKILSLIAAVAVSASVSAQAPQGLAQSKFTDNWYVGVQGGVNTPTTGHGWLKHLDYNGTLRVGKWISPVFGLQAEGTAYFQSESERWDGKHGDANFVDAVNVGLNTTWNLGNLFCGYKGEPRAFEVIGVYGLGWMHGFQPGGKNAVNDMNSFTSKAAIDLAYNFGSSKEWQVYVEPAILWNLSGSNTSGHALENPMYNIDRSIVQLNAGVVYKFGCSNGTHNFKLVDLRDQAEIDALNAKINELRGQVNGKDGEINRLKKALRDCESKPAPAPAPVVEQRNTALMTNLMPKVIFRQGKSVVDAAQVANVEMIAKYMKLNPDAKVLIKGYASPEGPADLNQRLSEQRAEAVKTMLINKYGIDASRLTTEGCGPTDTLSDVVDFNRVATFNDQTK